jgi:hypothetical protein
MPPPGSQSLIQSQILLYARWYIGCSQALGNYPPNNSSYPTFKERMVYIFFFVTELTQRVANPAPSYHVIFG